MDAAFFEAIFAHWDEIERVEPMLKPGGYDNELSRFRYDVTLTIGGKKQAQAEPQHWIDWAAPPNGNGN